ncbi:hypothetical protein [Mycoplasmopsis iners]|uniref:hypothetical protein n=1 Tax=Mycoplasmopsis iners TaxID=76630 RepID=UPI0004974E54|nr:hypothetical protein [Mycoplasmopsis iners]
MLLKYQQFLDEKYTKFQKAVPRINIKRDWVLALFIVFALFAFVCALGALLLLGLATFYYPRTQKMYDLRWIFFAIAMCFALLSILNGVLALYRLKWAKSFRLIDSNDDFLKVLYQLNDMNYVGRGAYRGKFSKEYQENPKAYLQESKKWRSLDWVTDSLALSHIAKDQKMKFVLGRVFANKDLNKNDNWKIQNIRMGYSADDMNSYLFMEGKITSKQFTQSYLFGPKFPMNSTFAKDPEVKYDLGQRYQIFSNQKSLNKEGYNQIAEFVDYLDLWNRGFGFYIDAETQKVYSWIKMDRELFQWKSIKHPENTLLRDIYLIGTLQNLPLLLD